MTNTNKALTETETSDLAARQMLGRDIRALRKLRGMTLESMADLIGRSVGFVSQLERGVSQASISDLRKIAKGFDVPISLFFGSADAPSSERGHIVRADARRKLGKTGGLMEELLSPDLGGDFEIIRCEFAPQTRRDDAVQRQTQEAGYIVSGTLELEIAGRWFKLQPGDSFRFSGEPYRWKNTTDQKTTAIWIISPPIY